MALHSPGPLSSRSLCGITKCFLLLMPLVVRDSAVCNPKLSYLMRITIPNQHGVTVTHLISAHPALTLQPLAASRKRQLLSTQLCPSVALQWWPPTLHAHTVPFEAGLQRSPQSRRAYK